MDKLFPYNTGAYAKERLVSLLARDRIGCNHMLLDNLKAAIINVVDEQKDMVLGDMDMQIRDTQLIIYMSLNSGRIINYNKMTKDD